MNDIFKDIKYFKSEEFDSPDEKGSGNRMNPEFLKLLDQIREKAGIPFKINSGYRTIEHNAKIGSKVPDSAHCKGVAVDISCTDSHSRYLIVGAAYEVGIVRIEVKSTWVHLDMDFDKPQRVLFLE